MTGEFHFVEDPEQPGDDTSRGAARSSWGTVAVIAVVSCLVAGAALWLFVPREGPQAPTSAAAAPAVPPSAEPTKRPAPAKPPYDGPPKITVQLGESMTGDCPAVFMESIVVRVYRGEADSIKAVARIPFDKVTRERELWEIDTEWSTMLGGLPTKRTIKLQVTATGLGGKTTIAEDISHPCTGEPVDKPDPADLSAKANRQGMKKMFDGGYDFEFDFEGKPGNKDKEPEPRETPEG